MASVRPNTSDLATMQVSYNYIHLNPANRRSGQLHVPAALTRVLTVPRLIGPTAGVDSVERRESFPTQGIESRFVGCLSLGLVTRLTELSRSLLPKVLKLRKIIQSVSVNCCHFQLNNALAIANLFI